MNRENNSADSDTRDNNAETITYLSSNFINKSSCNFILTSEEDSSEKKITQINELNTSNHCLFK